MTQYKRNYPIVLKLVERSVDNNGCREWTAGVDRFGYGRVWHKGKNQTAHTVAYSEQVEPIPEGLHVLHSCDNPKCIQLSHLRLGTHSDNMQDRSKRGRFVPPYTYTTKLPRSN